MSTIGPDVAIPLAFPDYLISVPAIPDPLRGGEIKNPNLPIPKGPHTVPLPNVGIPGIPRAIPISIPDQIPVPDLPLIDLPYVPPVIPIPDNTSQLPLLGHAGILFFDGASGRTKYYEYGRYDSPVGEVRRQIIPDVVLSNGRPTRPSLTDVLKTISGKSGQAGRILGAYIALPPGSYRMILSYCQKREADNTNPKRRPYELFTNSCCTFAREAAIAGRAFMPPIGMTPNPAMYLQKVRVSYPIVDYYPAPPVALAPAAGF